MIVSYRHRRLLLVFGIVSVGTISFLWQRSAASLGGTLVVATPCVDGLVIMADRTTKDFLRGKLEGPCKLKQADKFTVVASTGCPAFYDYLRFPSGGFAINKQARFDANQSAADYFKNKPVCPSIVDPQAWPPLAFHICENFIKAYRSSPIEQWPPERQEDNHCLFQTIVFHYNPKTNRFEVLQLKFRYRRVCPIGLSVDNPPIAYSLDAVKHFNQLFLGSTDVVETVKNGNEYPEFNSDGLLYRLSHPLRSGLSLREALRASARVTTLTSLKLPGSHPNPVGSLIDAMIIQPERGTQVLYTNVSTGQLDSISKQELRRAQSK